MGGRGAIIGMGWWRNGGGGDLAGKVWGRLVVGVMGWVWCLGSIGDDIWRGKELIYAEKSVAVFAARFSRSQSSDATFLVSFDYA